MKMQTGFNRLPNDIVRLMSCYDVCVWHRVSLLNRRSSRLTQATKLCVPVTPSEIRNYVRTHGKSRDIWVLGLVLARFAVYAASRDEFISLVRSERHIVGPGIIHIDRWDGEGYPLPEYIFFMYKERGCTREQSISMAMYAFDRAMSDTDVAARMTAKWSSDLLSRAFGVVDDSRELRVRVYEGLLALGT
jgi:hypothetical protein